MKLMVIMRGPSGSGKSTLTKLITAMCDFEGISSVICSADNHFINEKGKYHFIPEEIGVAHKSCQILADDHCRIGTNVVIIDNTNTTWREVRTYVEIARKHNYQFYLCEPTFGQTKWNIESCVENNLHGCDETVVKRQVNRYANSFQILMDYIKFLKG